MCEMCQKRSLALVMAAGESQRMKSSVPKMLHALCGRPILEHVLRALSGACDHTVVIVGHGRDQVMEAYHGRVDFAIQTPEAKGTGHAVRCAMDYLRGRTGPVVVTAADMPLVLPETYARLIQSVRDGNAGALLTDTVDNPFGYGRIVRENGEITRIVEQKDLTEAQKDIREINGLVCCFDAETLLWALPQLSDRNHAREVYLTDVVELITASGKRVVSVPVIEKCECQGINTREQLALREAEQRARINRRHMLSGVTLIDPAATYIDDDVTIGRDSVIHPGNTISAGTIIGENCVIMPGCRISASKIGSGARIESSVLIGADIEDMSEVGPFACINHKTEGKL